MWNHWDMNYLPRLSVLSVKVSSSKELALVAKHCKNFCEGVGEREGEGVSKRERERERDIAVIYH